MYKRASKFEQRWASRPWAKSESTPLRRESVIPQGFSSRGTNQTDSARASVEQLAQLDQTTRQLQWYMAHHFAVVAWCAQQDVLNELIEQRHQVASWKSDYRLYRECEDFLSRSSGSGAWSRPREAARLQGRVNHALRRLRRKLKSLREWIDLLDLSDEFPEELLSASVIEHSLAELTAICGSDESESR